MNGVMISIYPVAAFPATTVTAGAVLCSPPAVVPAFCCSDEAVFPYAACVPADPETVCVPVDAEAAAPEPAAAEEAAFPVDDDELRTTVLLVPPPTRSRPAANTLVAQPNMLNVSATVINIFVTFLLAPLIVILPLSSVKPVGNPLYSLTDTDYITVPAAKKAFILRLFYFSVVSCTGSVICMQSPQDLA